MERIIPRIETISEKRLIGLSRKMSFANFEVPLLWKDFLPLKSQILQPLASDLISLAVYHPEHFRQFDPNREFTKWAAVEVSAAQAIPSGLETFSIPAGDYAVFLYRGSSADPSIYQYIFGTWLPQSGYQLDERPHFEILGQKYRNNDPSSEEEIWIPIKLR